MKTLPALICLVLSSCDRHPSAPDGGSSNIKPRDKLVPGAPLQQPSTQTSGASPTRIDDAKVWALAKEIAQGKNGSRRPIAEFRSLAGVLSQQGILAASIERIPLPARNELVDLLVPVFRAKRERREFDAEYITALKLLNETPFRPESELLFEDLQRVPAYTFPKELPNPWDAANAVHLFKGYPGQIALALVARDDAKTHQLYRANLARSTGELRKVMIWALGHSTREDTFEYLMALSRESKGDEQALIVRSMNRIPLSIEQAMLPALKEDEKQSLSRLGSDLRQRLAAKQLECELSPWD